MSDLNSVTMTGRLVRDAEIKYTGVGVAITTFSIASNRSVKKGDKWEDEGQFFDVTMFGKSGEAIQKYLLKGTSIALVGELKQDRWEKDGKWNSRIGIVARKVKFMGGKQSSQGDREENGGYGTAPSHSGYSAVDSGYSPDDYPEDIPF